MMANGLAEGEAIITVKSKDVAKTDICTVTVQQQLVVVVEVSLDQIDLTIVAA